MGSIIVGRLKDKDAKSIGQRLADLMKRMSPQEKKAREIAHETATRQ